MIITHHYSQHQMSIKYHVHTCDALISLSAESESAESDSIYCHSTKTFIHLFTAPNDYRASLSQHKMSIKYHVHTH